MEDINKYSLSLILEQNQYDFIGINETWAYKDHFKLPNKNYKVILNSPNLRGRGVALIYKHYFFVQ